MAPITNPRIIFNDIPEGFPEIDKTLIYDTSQVIDLENEPLNGGFLVKTLDLSIDPYMRGRMRDPSVESYSPPFILGQPINGYGLGVVIRSENPDVKVGEYVYGSNIDHAQYFVRKDLISLEKVDNKYNLPTSVFVGALGMAGQTAFYAWHEFSHAKPGETVFVSAGAGTSRSYPFIYPDVPLMPNYRACRIVSQRAILYLPIDHIALPHSCSMVIQLAKKQGLKVIASAGSEDKIEFLKEIGTDIAFNYKTTNTLEVLKREGGIDLYWDNVGGETLEAALEAAKLNGRFIICGMISGYNSGDSVPVKNLWHIFSKSLTLSGFIVGRLAEKWGQKFREEMPARVASGEIKYREQIYEGLDKVPHAILDVQKGRNKAKAVVRVGLE
ncbi:hypothetical protein CVT24_011318 [Panaeolus cyanescens]|uniref:Enoyl reductase (ER) domain-containing protein n=1 Tax=Panaeolus cyanescens TaxID=181874 RepID=A0A409YUZ9_9AGAR|nr:hypothetical protein CVT24_011318 [Panaeolus cyanescens]